MDGMKGKRLEELCLRRMDKEEEAGRATMNRYGVHVSIRFDPATQARIVQVISSPPDFEGALHNGRQFIFDAKVCSASSYSIDSAGGKRARQIPFLIKRSRFNVITFLLLHFNERSLATKHDREVTWAFPVHHNHPFWKRYLAGEVKSISRTTCEDYAAEVLWSPLPKGKIVLPELLPAINCVAELLSEIDDHRELRFS